MRVLAIGAVAALALAGCGVKGGLDRPPPMFGDAKAKAEAEEKAKGERQRMEIPVSPTPPTAAETPPAAEPSEPKTP